MPIYLRIDMSKKDAYLAKERLTHFFEILNQKNASVPDRIFQELGFEVEKFNLGKIKCETLCRKIDNLLKNVVGEEVCLDA